MYKEILQARGESAPLGPSGPAGADSSSSRPPSEDFKFQTRNLIYKDLICSHGLNPAAIITKLYYWTQKMIKHSGSRWCFRSAAALAEDIGGISESAVRDQLKDLERKGEIEIRPGRPRAGLNAASEYLLCENIIEIIESASGEPDSPSPSAYYGLDDAIRYGIGPALLLTHLEWVQSRGQDARGFIITRKVAEYFGVGQRKVERWICSLKEKRVLVELERRLPERQLRIAEGLDRRPTITIIYLESEDRRIQPMRPERTNVAGLPPNPLALLTDRVPPVCFVTHIATEEPAPNFTDTDVDYRSIVERNRFSREVLNDSDREAISAFIESLDLNQTVELGSMGPDGTVAFFMEHGIRHCPFRDMLGAELFTLAFQLRRRSWLPSSSPALRRTAYGLALDVRGRLAEARRIREKLLNLDSIPGVYEPDLSPAEKRQCLELVVTSRNQIGIEILISRRFECPNPEVRRNYIQRVRQGLPAAEGFFKKHPEYAVADVLRMLDECAAALPRPEDSRAADPDKHLRSGKNLDSFFRNFAKIANE